MREIPLILICDDDPQILKSLQLSLKSGFELHTSSSVAQAKIMAKAHEYDAAIIDLNFEGQELDGVHLLDYFGKVSPGTYLIVLSGDQSVKRVVEAMRRKLFQFIHKEGDYYADLYSSLNRSTQLKKAKEQQAIQKYLTNSPAVKEVLKKAERIIQNKQDASILILGETGTGKESLVKHIACNMKKKLVSANMATIGKETAESNLFGHERGAFTGAVQNKIGLIESANNGMFFLDEIGDCSLEVQSKLLRVIQEREVQPLGSNRARSINVSFIAATHRNLKKMVQNGEFREDLLQRLNTFPLIIPPLRERLEDIIFYANLYLEECGDESVGYTISNDGIQELLSYSWPGNIRELKSVIQRFVVLSNKTILDADAVKTAIGMGESSSQITATTKIEIIENNLKKDELIKAITTCNGNKTQAAAELGINVRTLHRWVNKFNIPQIFSAANTSKL
ncbi:MAG: sigma-54 dependent transcriptional regulator [Bacteriovorax sp.]|nr:sigma-54 dependent transcriptional regulator [Bacteriovorax sp.]